MKDCCIFFGSQLSYRGLWMDTKRIAWNKITHLAPIYQQKCRSKSCLWSTGPCIFKCRNAFWLLHLLSSEQNQNLLFYSTAMILLFWEVHFLTWCLCVWSFFNEYTWVLSWLKLLPLLLVSKEIIFRAVWLGK